MTHQRPITMAAVAALLMAACGQVRVTDAYYGGDVAQGDVPLAVDTTATDAKGDAGEPDAGPVDGGPWDATQDAGPIDGGAPELPPQCQVAADCAELVGPLGPCDAAVCAAGACQKANAQEGKFCGFECGGEGGQISYRKSSCIAGACKPAGDPVVCVPDFACLVPQCSPQAGCIYLAEDGKCGSSNQCTSAICKADTGCIWTPKEGACDDGDSCTQEDKCQSGTCKGGYNKCACQGDGNCKTINPCLPASCGPGKFCINQVALGTPCDDQDGCTNNDKCNAAGDCAGEPTNCDDKIACTKDSCASEPGCLHVPDSSLCDDGNPCTTGTCLEKGCQSVDNAGDPCDDGNACTVGDTCSGALCTGKAGPPCPAPGPCKTSACDPLTGQCPTTPVADGSPCNDGSACTKVDLCKGGLCGDGKPPCDDGKPCTVDACEPAKGCTHKTNESGPCDDGDPCTKGDHCVSGACKPGAAAACDDGNLCTLDTCDASGACAYPPVKGGKPCAEGSKMCQSGKCAAVKPPAGMAWIAANTFQMGCNGKVDGKCKDHENPSHPVTLSSYYIDLKEVSASAYKVCVLATKCSPPKTGGAHATYNTAKTSHPINYIQWQQAAQFCAAQGSRLCTEAEWEYAARGGDGRVYPWGNSSPSCSLAVANDCTSGPAAGGSKPAGASPFGLLDMAGNVREWTADWYGAKYYASGAGAAMVNPKGPLKGTTRVFRGGHYASTAAQVRTSERAFIDPSIGSATVGFRCCRSIN